MDKNLLSKIESLEFMCQRCSNCCRFQPGAVFLTEDDVQRICSYLNMDTSIFIRKYCRLLIRNNEQVVSLQERKNFDCIFWNDGCVIYEARPLQCSTYPFWPFIVESDEEWEHERKRCPGINVKGELSFEQKLDYYTKEKNAKYMKI